MTDAAARKIVFRLDGKPHGKERPRLGKAGNVYTPTATKAYERSIGWAARMARPPGWDRAAVFEVSLVCFFPDNRRRDIDNVLKSVLDGMKGIAYWDDEQVYAATVRRGETDRARPRVEVVVTGLDSPAAGSRVTTKEAPPRRVSARRHGPTEEVK